MTEHNLRRATSHDLADLMQLEHDGFTHAVWTSQGWLDEISGTDRQVFVIESESQVIAAATFQHVAGADSADLHRIVVTPSQRGKRHGDRLVTAGCQWAHRDGAERMILEVENTNMSALALYRRLGFAEISCRDNYYAPGAHALVMVKELENE
ncbi:MAG: GNAT family N-acetyltransferase [Propionibacteriaceae bacterium]